MHLNCSIKRYALQRNFKVQQIGTKELLFPEVTELDLLNSQLPCDALPLRQRVLSLQGGTLIGQLGLCRGCPNLPLPFAGKTFPSSSSTGGLGSTELWHSSLSLHFLTHQISL